MKYNDRLQEINQDKRVVTSNTSSLMNPSKNMAYAPSVTVTPTGVYVKPLKLAKTNRVIREPKFGGPFNFCLG